MRLLVDRNLSPRWVKRFAQDRITAVHWSSVGRADAPDAELMDYAREASMVVLTHDLDFGGILAATRQTRPSVVQIRAANLDPEIIGGHVITSIRRVMQDLETGALLTIYPERARLRLLPF